MFDPDYYIRVTKAIKGKWKGKTTPLPADPDKLMFHLKKWNSERKGWQSLVKIDADSFAVEPIIDWDGTFPPGFWTIERKILNDAPPAPIRGGQNKKILTLPTKQTDLF